MPLSSPPQGYSCPFLCEDLCLPRTGREWPEYNFKNGRSCAWPVCLCSGDHVGLVGQESEKKEGITHRQQPEILSFFLTGDIGNQSLMAQRAFEINATVSSFPWHLLQGHRMTANTKSVF